MVLPKMFLQYPTALHLLGNNNNMLRSSVSESIRLTTALVIPSRVTVCHSNVSSSSSSLYGARTFSSSPSFDRHGTTIVCVRKNGYVCMMGDGMVSQGSMIVKPNALKLRRIVSKTGGGSSSSTSSSSSSSSDDNNKDNDEADKIVTIVGFAGSTADAFTLLERLEGKLDEYPGQLARSCVELAKGWRTDKYLRRLEASLIVADAQCSLELTGNGDVLESHDGVLGVGSGSVYAIAAARALMDIPELSAEDVARKAMRVASDMCVYTNDNYRIEIIKTKNVESDTTTATTSTTVKLDDSEVEDKKSS